jgi:hypothetical protein
MKFNHEAGSHRLIDSRILLAPPFCFGFVVLIYRRRIIGSFGRLFFRISYAAITESAADRVFISESATSDARGR